jgi:predicted transcriptional regulator
MRLLPFDPFSLRRLGRGARSLGPLELDVLERVWRGGELCVRDLCGQFGERLAYTTVMTTLDRLYKKGVLHRRKEGRAFFYSAAVTRDRFYAIAAREALAPILSVSQPQLSDAVSYLVEAISESDAALLDELERAVKERRRKERKA